ncbi:hypothetical protein P171DRAFT_447099 [Karstenula rhodostoma CBS 690.94]|uniref:Uncharacterized protein n=1 Tax=Karstenula rhodostoma CBS 690.94 TaxID=1392251 RepID=A0A9P4PC52_9PLEO|nr:hypothetical protein P171DRAFT_447099 [Karstenula rhodostoma CBS 690.94]
MTIPSQSLTSPQDICYATPSKTYPEDDILALVNYFGSSPQNNDDEDGWEDEEDHPAPTTARVPTSSLLHHWDEIEESIIGYMALVEPVALVLLRMWMSCSIGIAIIFAIWRTSCYASHNVAFASATPTVTGTMTNAEEDVVSATLLKIYETPATTTKSTSEATGSTQSEC